MTDIEKYMADNNVTQITFMPAMSFIKSTDDGFWNEPAKYSVVIGNNRYFGFTIAEAVEKAQ